MIRPISLTAYQKSMEMDEDLIGPRLTSCPFCLKADFFDYGVSLHKKPPVRLLKCNWCKALFADRMPTKKALDSYYSDYYARYRTNVKGAVTHGSTERFAKHLAELYLKYAPRKKISLLDYGGGDGSLGAGVKDELVARGLEVENVYLVDVADIDPVEGVVKLSSLDREGGKRFDFIIASAILEHLTEPRGHLGELAKRGDFIYFRTPFAAPLIKLMGKFGISVDFTYPGHVSDLGVEFYDNLNKCLPEAKVKTLYSGASPVETSLKQGIFRTVMAYMFKSPYALLGYLGVGPAKAIRVWPFVGGCEAFIEVVK